MKVDSKGIVTYRRQVQEAVNQYCTRVTPVARSSKYLGVLQENQERLQGSLVLLGYELLDGADRTMIIRAALAIELFHAYICCIEQGIDTEQALRAQHEAEIILANLETDPENCLKALSITNRTLMLANLARLGTTSMEDKVLWQATELTLNPIHVGQVLAGADCHATNAVTPLTVQVGKQLTQGKIIDSTQLFEDLRQLTW